MNLLLGSCIALSVNKAVFHRTCVMVRKICEFLSNTVISVTLNKCTIMPKSVGIIRKKESSIKAKKITHKDENMKRLMQHVISLLN